MKQAMNGLELEKPKLQPTDIEYTDDFKSIDWDEMTTYWLIFNLTNFHGVDIYMKRSGRDFLAWLRTKYRQRKVKLSTELLKAQKSRLERWGYNVTLDPLTIEYAEF